MDWSSLIVGSKLPFLLVYYIWRGDTITITEGFLRYRFGGHIFGGAYTRRGFLSEFYGMTMLAFDSTTSVMLKMHAQYGTKTRGTRLKNGKSQTFSAGKKEEETEDYIFLRSSSLNMAGKLQALRK